MLHVARRLYNKMPQVMSSVNVHPAEEGPDARQRGLHLLLILYRRYVGPHCAKYWLGHYPCSTRAA